MEKMANVNEKNTSGFGRLWGWSNPEEEKKYVERIKKDFTDHPTCGAVIPYSQLIEYPELGLQCIQTETWVKLDSLD